LTDDLYYTDGLRVVIFLASEPVPIEQVDFIKWGEPATGETLASRRAPHRTEAAATHLNACTKRTCD
jgi:hypothetical protein